MSKKPSGLGKSLGELFEDNTPEVHGGATVIKKSDGAAVVITPTSGGPSDITPPEKPKSLFEELPKNRSIKANFKNFR